MGREVGGEFRMGNTCKSMADSCQCMAKTTTILKVISLHLIKIIGEGTLGEDKLISVVARILRY